MNLPGRLDYSNLTVKTQVGLQWSNLKQLLGKYYVVTEFQLRVKSNIYILWWKPYMFRKGLVIQMFSCPLLISFGTPLLISWGWDSVRKESARTEHAQCSTTIRQRTGTPTADFKDIYLSESEQKNMSNSCVQKRHRRSANQKCLGV